MVGKASNRANTDEPPKDANRRTNTSLRLPAKTLKALKIRALEEDTSVQALLESLVEDYLEMSKEPR